MNGSDASFAGPDNAEERVLAVLRRTTLDIVPEVEPASFTPDRTLSDLGCNSIDRAEIVTLTMEELDIAVPVHEFHQGMDIGTLAALMRKQL
ncbi:phosphopantetheine-binding protein [Streptomyces sp. MH60]|uniref:phosphopantetheine-binding protein n=1 Tax=Streptomyces sp. MH60 TaxID=1940758 RepID=UPI000CEDAF2A|nr:phosphopantetheine-binding protein [Streptomyces sp. MH60]PPS86023.1 Polyketide biosynthesis acyl-carrier-protein AcpK [Streptomyces sp. MH60]